MGASINVGAPRLFAIAMAGFFLLLVQNLHLPTIKLLAQRSSVVGRLQTSTADDADDELDAIETDTSVTTTTSFSSPACRPYFPQAMNKITRLHHHHMRKAGGTTIGHFLKGFCRHYNITFTSNEGGIPEWPDLSNGTTLYVTHLREPTARALSHYKYSGRWKCFQLVDNKTFVPTIENSASLESFLEGDKADPPKTRKSMNGLLWSCAHNCYIRWCSDLPTHVSDMQEALITARRRLSQYHVILVTEKFQDAEYVQEVERMFGFPWPETNSHVLRASVPGCQ